MRPGENFKPQLADQIAAREVFLLFWSRHAAASPWVRWEYATALERKGARDSILPMPLEDSAIGAAAARTGRSPSARPVPARRLRPGQGSGGIGARLGARVGVDQARACT